MGGLGITLGKVFSIDRETRTYSAEEIKRRVEEYNKPNSEEQSPDPPQKEIVEKKPTPDPLQTKLGESKAKKPKLEKPNPEEDTEFLPEFEAPPNQRKLTQKEKDYIEQIYERKKREVSHVLGLEFDERRIDEKIAKHRNDPRAFKRDIRNATLYSLSATLRNTQNPQYKMVIIAEMNERLKELSPIMCDFVESTDQYLSYHGEDAKDANDALEQMRNKCSGVGVYPHEVRKLIIDNLVAVIIDRHAEVTVPQIRKILAEEFNITRNENDEQFTDEKLLFRLKNVKQIYKGKYEMVRGFIRRTGYDSSKDVVID